MLDNKILDNNTNNTKAFTSSPFFQKKQADKK